MAERSRLSDAAVIRLLFGSKERIPQHSKPLNPFIGYCNLMLIDQLVVVVDSTRPAVFRDTLTPKLTKLSGIPKSHDHMRPLKTQDMRLHVVIALLVGIFMAHRKEVQLFKLFFRRVIGCNGYRN